MKMNNQTKFIMMIMILVNLMSLSSSNWMFSWILMEMSTLMFLPIMSLSKKMSYQIMKFFMIQSISSSMMIMTLMIKSIITNKFFIDYILIISMTTKLGLVPMHMWVPQTFSFMSFFNCFIMSTIQKISPMVLMTQTLMIKLMILPLTSSLLLSSINMMKQNKSKKIMAFMSISSTPWMIISMNLSKEVFLYFLSIYSYLNLNLMNFMEKINLKSMNQMWTKSIKEKFFIGSTILSTSGMPPFMGFIPKWMILQMFAPLNMMMTMTLIFSSALMSFSMMKFMINNLTLSTPYKKSLMKKMNNENLFLTINSSLILMLCLIKN